MAAIVFSFACRKNEPGPQGPAGPQGIQGIQGEKGDKGDTGDTGLQGEKGDKGDTGDTGLQGEKGDKGDTGDTGLQGEKGDKGDNGDKGDTGATGLQGNPGEDALLRQGRISGMLSGISASGIKLDEEFSFEYYPTMDDSEYHNYGEGLSFSFGRRAAKDSENRIAFSMNTYEGEAPDRYGIRMSFSYRKDLGNGRFLKFSIFPNKGQLARLSDYEKIYFDGDYSDIVISNYKFDDKTGEMYFDFEASIHYDENSTGNPATIKGTVNVIVNEAIYRKGTW